MLFGVLLLLMDGMPGLVGAGAAFHPVHFGDVSLSAAAVFRIVLGMAAAGPYLVLLVVADRLLTLRKGLAVLSCVAVVAWVGAAVLLADRLAILVPDLPANSLVPGIGGMALLAHLGPIWIGLQDRGLVGQPGAQAADTRRVSGQPGVGAVVGSLAVTAVIAGLIFQQGLFRVGGAGPGVPAAVGPVAAADLSADRVAPVPRAVVRTVGLPPARQPAVVAEPAIPVLVEPSAQSLAQAAPMPVVITPSFSARGDQAVAKRDRFGSFSVDAEVNGVPLQMAFDTGASLVVLRAEDAARVGLDPGSLTYSRIARTANGVAEEAPVMLASLTVGGITRRNVAAAVARAGKLDVNLLGQSFLSRIAGFHVEGNELILKGAGSD